MASEMHNENIIFGGAVGVDVTKDVKSLGEYILRELSVHGDKVAIVSYPAYSLLLLLYNHVPSINFTLY